MVAKRLKMSQPGVVYAINRGERIAKVKALNMIKQLLNYKWMSPKSH